MVFDLTETCVCAREYAHFTFPRRMAMIGADVGCCEIQDYMQSMVQSGGFFGGGKVSEEKNMSEGKTISDNLQVSVKWYSI